MRYSVEIQASNTDGHWQTLHTETTADVEDTASEVAAEIADNQTVTDPGTYNWRIRVWNGANADTGIDPAAEYRPPTAISRDDMRRQVIVSLTEYVDDVDVDGLVEELASEWGCVTIDAIPFADYWAAVARFDKSNARVSV